MTQEEKLLGAIVALQEQKAILQSTLRQVLALYKCVRPVEGLKLENDMAPLLVP